MNQNEKTVLAHLNAIRNDVNTIRNLSPFLKIPESDLCQSLESLESSGYVYKETITYNPPILNDNVWKIHRNGEEKLNDRTVFTKSALDQLDYKEMAKDIISSETYVSMDKLDAYYKNSPIQGKGFYIDLAREARLLLTHTMNEQVNMVLLVSTCFHRADEIKNEPKKKAQEKKAQRRREIGILCLGAFLTGIPTLIQTGLQKDVIVNQSDSLRIQIVHDTIFLENHKSNQKDTALVRLVKQPKPKPL